MLATVVVARHLLVQSLGHKDLGTSRLLHERFPNVKLQIDRGMYYRSKRGIESCYEVAAVHSTTMRACSSCETSAMRSIIRLKHKSWGMFAASRSFGGTGIMT